MYVATPGLSDMVIVDPPNLGFALIWDFYYLVIN